MKPNFRSCARMLLDAIPAVSLPNVARPPAVGTPA
jgi:hypothetical protein